MWRHITWATDFSELSDAALYFVLPLAKQMGSNVALVHCIPNIAAAYTSGQLLEPLPAEIPILMGNVLAQIREEAIERLEAKASELRSMGIGVEVHILQGDAHHAVIEFAHKSETDLIAIGTKGVSGIGEKLLGSTTARIIQGSDKPVLSINQPRKPKLESMLVPTDLSEASSFALSYAIALAKLIGASVHVLHVMELLEAIGERETVNRLEVMVKAKLEVMAEAANGISDKTHIHALKRHHAAEGILEFVDENNIDLVIMTTHGRTGLARFLWGSVAERVIRECSAPVIAARAKAFERALSKRAL
ncbi:MAG: universal stress protein [Armatimonadota bacterium]|nr:universal stress protein [Armatimonadota bacterium]MCX7778183.1 universal stress protein [Armatimonadota bacterium]MDW8026224.1 universal stress protein [Armatimonadota bacterium]